MLTVRALGAGLLLIGAGAATVDGRSRQDSPPVERPGRLESWVQRLAKDGRDVALADTTNLVCDQCHAEIALEWRHSRHATAWQDEYYQRALRKVRKKERCTGCHAPEPLIAHELPAIPSTRGGDRVITIKTRLLDDEGDLVAEAEQRFDYRSYLPVEEVLELVLDGEGVLVQVEGRHEAPGLRRFQRFIEREVEVEGSR